MKKLILIIFLAWCFSGYSQIIPDTILVKLDTAGVVMRPIAGTGMTITGTYPDITFSSTATGNYWGLSGTTGTTPNTNYIGTSDNKDVVFKRNAIIAGIISNTVTNSGTSNVSFGLQTIPFAATGTLNTALGTSALRFLTLGGNNVSIGSESLYANTTGGGNTAVGMSALRSNVSSGWNTAIGYQSLYTNTASHNTAIGYQSMLANTSGANNTGIGENALLANTTGYQNSSLGYSSLKGNTTGAENLSAGYGSWNTSTTGNQNTAIGNRAGQFSASSNNNTLLGYSANINGGSGSGKVIIGSNAGINETASNKLHIANNANNTLINGDFSTGALNFSPLIMSTATQVQSSTGGSMSAGTYYFVVVALDNTGAESSLSNQLGFTATGSTSSDSIKWAAVPGAVSYKVYKGTVSGTYTEYFATTGLFIFYTGAAGTAGSPSTFGTAYQFRFTANGAFKAPSIITAAGTTGDQTINRMNGTVNIAASGSTVTVTNSLVSTSSIVLAVIRTNDATAIIKNVVPSIGSFTINLTSTTTSEISVGFTVIN